MKVFVTGVNGQLGHDVINELNKRGIDAIASDITDSYAGMNDSTAVCFSEYVRMDITNAEEVESVLFNVKPDAIIHAAGWTQVDAAEDEANYSKVVSINVEGTENIAKCAKVLNAKMMYISTDYVFNGLGTTPWTPDCKDYAPLNVYGKTKLEGEKTVSSSIDKFFIVRIAWVFGINGKNFVKTMLKLSENHNELSVVSDQIGTPTYTYDLSSLLVDMIQSEKYGYYHATNEGGYISWYDFAVEIFKVAGRNVIIHPVTTAEYGISKAKRPFNSRLDKSKLIEKGFTPLPDWRDALRRYIKLLE